MDWLLVLLSLLVAAGTIWWIRYFFKRIYKELGQISCRWYTGPAISGIVILGSYTIGILYLYYTSLVLDYLLLFPFGLIVLGFYYYFGCAAIGSAGVFINGRIIPWKAMYGYQLTEKWGNRLQWQVRWRESSAPAGDRLTIVIIPASHRVKAQEIIRDTLGNQSDDPKA